MRALPDPLPTIWPVSKSVVARCDCTLMMTAFPVDIARLRARWESWENPLADPTIA
ncbi:MAG: hypothetical protein ACJAYU_004265, partial [Bradymonadia bacterium]